METQTLTPLPPEKKQSERLISINALRGFDMFFLIWGTGLFSAFFLAVYPPLGDLLNSQFEHSLWSGLTFYDCIFPLFLFISGVSIPFAITKRLEQGEDRAVLYKHIFWRFIWLLILGFIYNNLNKLGSPLDWRLTGVLQRFAFCNLIASLVVMNFKPKNQFFIAIGLLLLYWAMMALIPVPGIGAGVYTPAGNLSGYIDRLILPNEDAWCCYQPYGDSEGILSTIPAISTCMFGMLTGHWLRSDRTQSQKLGGLFLVGIVMIIIALLWSLVFPINKYIWTSSFVFITGGINILLVGIFYGIIDVLGWKRWAIFFTIIGMNSILIYVFHDFIGAIVILAIFGWIISLAVIKE